MRNFKETIGKKIKERRKAMGFKTQESLGIAVGADRTRVSRWESGENLPDPVYRDKLIEKLGLAHSFFDEIPASESPQDQSIKDLEAKIDALGAKMQVPAASPKDAEDLARFRAMEAKYAKHGPDIIEKLMNLKDYEIIELRIDLGLPSLYREKKKPDESLVIRSNPQPLQEKPAVGSRDRKK